MAMDLETILTSPRVAIEKILTDLNTSLNGDTVPKDYNTAFHNLMEISRNLAVDSLTATSNIIRKKFPVLANNMEDLFFNIHDEVKDNLFAIGGTVPIIFYINVIDLKQFGTRENNSYITNIPAGSTITVLDTVFTLLNDITITLKDNNIITVEQKESDLDIAINDIRLLTPTIITDDANIEWIIFETKVRNILKKTITIPVTHDSDITTDILLTKQYSTIEVGHTVNGIYQPIKISYSDEYIDENNATALIALKDNSVSVTIPKIYLLERMIGNNVIVDLYETDGEKVLDLSRLTTDDFILNIENQGKDAYSATSINIIMAVVSRGTLSNGVNAMTFEELKKAIIESTLGDIDLPITSYQITRKLKMYGYELRVITDTLLGRMFIASKPLPVMDSKMIYAFPDIFFNKAEVIINEDNTSNSIELYTNSFIIKENTIYFKDKDGILKILPDSELEYFNKLNKSSKTKYLQNKRLFYSPLTYVVKYDKEITNSEVYYLKPEVKNIRILNTNTNLEEKVNTSKYGIIKTKEGYLLRTKPVLDSTASSSNLNLLRARLHIPIMNSNSTVYFDSEYDPSTGLFSFDINTGDLFDSVYDIINGKSVLKDIKINLDSNMYLYIYSEDPNIIDSSKFLLSELGSVDTDVSIFSKELLTISLGKKLDYVYNNILSLFTNKQYKRYTNNVPMVYEETVYRKYDNGLIINPIELSNGQVDLGLEIEHLKGETVLDSNGNQIYKYRVNDIVIDDKGNPVVDKYSGIKRVIDILMLEYEFFVSDAEVYQNYRELMLNSIMSMVDVDMNELNNVTMDKTKIKYKTFRNINDVMVITNNIAYPMPYYITPKVTLILDKNNLISDTELLEDIKAICGKVITKHLNSEKIVLDTVKKDLINNISISVIGIKISGIEPKNSEIVILTDDNRFTINKLLVLTETNTTVVKYDIDLELEYI